MKLHCARYEAIAVWLYDFCNCSVTVSPLHFPPVTIKCNIVMTSEYYPLHPTESVEPILLLVLKEGPTMSHSDNFWTDFLLFDKHEAWFPSWSDRVLCFWTSSISCYSKLDHTNGTLFSTHLISGHHSANNRERENRAGHSHQTESRGKILRSCAGWVMEVYFGGVSDRWGEGDAAGLFQQQRIFIRRC